MFSGGMPLSPTTNYQVPTSADEADLLRNDMNDQQGVVSDAGTATTDARNELEDKQTELSDKRQVEADERSEESYHENQVRSKRQSLEQAIEQLDQYSRNLENELRGLKVDWNQVMDLYEKAAFEYQMFLRQLKDTVDEGCEELYAEARNKWGEIVRLMMAHSSNLSRAMIADLTGRLSAPLQPNFLSLFRPRSAPDKAYERTQASAVSADRNARARQANIQERMQNNPYEPLVTKDKEDLAQAEADYSKVEATYAAAKSGAEAAEGAWRSAREVYNEESEKAQEAKDELDAMERSLQTYANEQSEAQAAQNQEEMEQRRKEYEQRERMLERQGRRG